MKKSILIISYSELKSDPRVSRQIGWLKDDYAVTAAGLGDPCMDGVRFYKLTKHLSFTDRLLRMAAFKTRQFETAYWDRNRKKDAAALARDRWDMIIANDIDALPLAAAISKTAPIYFDAHEYFPREFEESFLWRFLFQAYKTELGRLYIPRAGAMTTVCEGIAEEFQKTYGVKPGVVTNAPDYVDQSPSPLAPPKIRIIHHGTVIPSRKMELMFDAADLLDDRFSVDFAFVSSDKAYMESLKQRAARSQRTRIIPPVPMKELPTFLNQYDIGLYILYPSNFNNHMALPNKLFEFIQGRLAVAIAPSPEMARIVHKYDLGVVAGDFTAESMAAVLNALSFEKIQYYKSQSHLAAKELSSLSNRDTILNITNTLLQKSHDAH